MIFEINEISTFNRMETVLKKKKKHFKYISQNIIGFIQISILLWIDKLL